MSEEDVVFGLMDYNARFYSPTLGRFTQPDMVIPGLTNSQAWNRYSYVLNSPIMYIDPTGHTPCMDGDCDYQDDLLEELEKSVDEQIADFDVDLVSESNASWKGKGYEKRALLVALTQVGSAISKYLASLGLSYSVQEAFKLVFNPLKFKMCNPMGANNVGTCEMWSVDEKEMVRTVNSGMITYGHTTVGVSGGLGKGQSLINNFIHELGHVFNNTVKGAAVDRMNDWNGTNPDYHRTTTSRNFGFYGTGFPWQQAVSQVRSGSENFADSFLGWAYNLWETDKSGNLTDAASARSDFMNVNMADWIDDFLP